MSRTDAELFADHGFIVVRGMLSPSEAAFYTERLTQLAGGAERWTQPDGVNRNPELWPIIFNERLLAAVRHIFGRDIRYLPHNDLHVGFSSFSWHRDNVTRNFGHGSDWDQTQDVYRIARVGIYLQRFEESHFKLGIVKRSHRSASLDEDRQRRVRRRTSAVANVLAGLSGVDMVGADAEWIATDPGDCVIFDPRCLHTGTKFHGKKYSIFVAYGVENSHFRNHWHYYLKLRSDLGYSAVPSALADRLQAAGLLASEPGDAPTIDGAWIPSSAFNYIAKRFK